MVTEARRRPRRRTALVVGLLGLVMVGSGFSVVVNTEVTCHGRPMAADDECFRRFTPRAVYSQPWPKPAPAYEYFTTYQQEQLIQRWPGGLLLAVGTALALGSWRLSRRHEQTTQARQQHAGQRAAVAAAQGWVYRRQDWSVTHAWQDERLLGDPPAARDVLSGTANELPFQLFDVEHTLPEAIDVRGGVRRFTVCAVPLGFTPPTLQVIATREHLAHLRVVSPFPAEEVDLAESDAAFNWAATVRTMAASEAMARDLLTPAVMAHVRAHQLSFVLLGPWLSVTVPPVQDAAAIRSLVAVSTELAGLLG